MDTGAPVIFAATVIFLVMAALLIFVQIEARKRMAALQGLAQQMGFTFIGSKWDRKRKVHQLGTALFQRNSNATFKNAMVGSFAGLETSLFDCSYTIGTGKGSAVMQTMAAFSQRLWLPAFELRPEGFLDRIGEEFVRMDIDFDSHPAFSRRYFLRGSSEALIRKLFAPSLLTFLEQLPTNEKWHIEGNLTTLVIYQSGVEVPPEELRAFLDKTATIAQEFFRSPEALGQPVR